MKILVIGSKGFIGSHIFNHFFQRGIEVYGADILDNDNKQDQYYRVDKTNPEFSAIFEYSGFDVCINCSGSGNVPDSVVDPLRDYFLNAVNVFKILNAIKVYQPTCKFVNLSSAAVYGNPSSLPIHEFNRTNPLSPYGFHKLQAEFICKEYYVLFGIMTCSLRIFSVYGPGLKKQLFWDLYQKTRSSIAINLFGTGDESRDFIYIADLVRAIELIINHSVFNGENINIANGMEIKIRDAVSAFYKKFPYPINYSFTGEVRVGDPLNWQADISKIKSLGYKPSVNLDDGLCNYYNWLQDINCK